MIKLCILVIILASSVLYSGAVFGAGGETGCTCPCDTDVTAKVLPDDQTLLNKGHEKKSGVVDNNNLGTG